MKIAVALIGVMLITQAIYAQPNTVSGPPCTDPSCRDAKFLYRLCNPLNGNWKLLCTANPNNEPGWVMYKKALPQQICADFAHPPANFSRVWVNDSDPLNFTQWDVFLVNHLTDLCRAAESSWDRLCPAQGPNEEYQQCCVMIRWSNADSDMGGDVSTRAATTHIFFNNKNPQHEHLCQYDCTRSVIILNQQSAFTMPDFKGRPTHFLYTEYQNINKMDHDTYSYYDAYSALLHEFGHWFGFGHEDDEDIPCDHHPFSIMRTGSIKDWAWYHRDLVSDDVCMFMKAYCCEQTKAGVEEVKKAKHTGLDFKVFPNPANTFLTLEFAKPLLHRSALIRILTNAGDMVLERKLGREVQKGGLDVSELPAGMYLVEVIGGDEVSSRKVEIVK